MRHFLLLLCISISFAEAIYAQTGNFEDGFSDGDFTSNPAWTGNTDKFIIAEQAGNFLLQLQDTAGGSAFLSTPSGSVTGFWEFFVRFSEFAPSDANRTDIYLMSNNPDLNAPLNGYLLRGGENGSGDVFRLFKVTNGNLDGEIITGTTNISAGGDFRVRVDRDSAGNWALQVGEGMFGTLIPNGMGTDNTYTSATHFGLKATYTATRSTSFFYDFKIDLPPLQITDVEVVDNQTIQVSFSDELDNATIIPQNFTIDKGIGNPDEAVQLSPGIAELRFNLPLPGGTFLLTVNNIRNASGDSEVEQNSSISFSLFDTFEPGDILINEFMKDPPTGLAEYVELINTSSKTLNLKDWRIGDNNSIILLSATDAVIPPDSFLVISPDTAALRNTFGAALYIQRPLPALNNAGDQIRIFNPFSTVDSLQYDASWGGVKVSVERLRTDLLSTLRANWADSPNPDFGTPGRKNEAEQDTEPPVLTLAKPLTSTTLRLGFSEGLVSEPAENPASYSLRAIDLATGNPSSAFQVPEITSAGQTHPDSVLLQLSFGLSQLPAGFLYEIEAGSIPDIFGNQQSTSLRFNFIVIEEALSGDLIINEFMYDPADGFSEFIELKNISTKNVDLKNWTYNDNSGTRRIITDLSEILLPGEFIVLAPNETILSLFPDIRLIPMGSNFSALNNSGDQIVIRNASGILLDSLQYTPEWGGVDVSLERKSSTAPTEFKENWGDSPSLDFGTPGMENLVEPDVEPPVVVNLSFFNNSSIKITYNERVDEAAARNIDNYTFSPQKTVTFQSVANTEVVIFFSEPFADGETFTITIRDQLDIFQNRLESFTGEATFVVLSQPAPREIVINEILYRRNGEENPEFIEIFNPTARNFDISGWQLQDATSTRATIPAGTVLAAGNFLVLTDRQQFAQSIPNALFLSNFPSLNDAGDAVILRNADGVAIDSLFYRSEWGGNIPGVTLERKDPLSASADASNWGTAAAGEGNTAGTENSIFEADQTPPEIIFSRLQPDETVFAVFSEFISIEGAEFRVNGATRPVLEFTTDMADRVTLSAPGISTGIPLTLDVQNISDFRGNSSAQLSIEIAQPIIPGDIIINEIMFAPIANSDDNLPDQTEYVELHNRRDFAVSLEGIFISDAPDESGNVRALIPVSDRFRQIPPGGFSLVYAENASETFASSRLAGFFGLESVPEVQTFRINAASLSLNNTSDSVFLKDSTGSTIDSVFYSSSWHNPNRFDVNGVALERISPDGPGNDASNWSSSTDAGGGSPLRQNTIFQSGTPTDASNSIDISPNPFSPDDDGKDDVTFINYRFDEPDYMLRIRIFDRNGRKVRTLVDGFAAGFEGSIIWDGFTDDNSRNRVGVYVVLAEATNSASGKNKSFKKTVVIARNF